MVGCQTDPGFRYLSETHQSVLMSSNDNTAHALFIICHNVRASCEVSSPFQDLMILPRHASSIQMRIESIELSSMHSGVQCEIQVNTYLQQTQAGQHDLRRT